MNISKKLLCITLCALLMAAPAQADVWSSISNFFSSTQNRVLAVVGGLVSVYCLYNVFWKKAQPKKTEKKADNKSAPTPLTLFDGWDIPLHPRIADSSPGEQSHGLYLTRDAQGKESSITITAQAAGICRGRERVLPFPGARGIWLKQVLVADQHSKDQNNKGGDASCGYHSVKNFAVIAKSLNDADYAHYASTGLTSFDIVNDLFGKYKDNKKFGLHRKQVLQSDKQHVDDGDWITDNDIKDLIKKESQPLGILDKIPFGLSVIENISQEKIPAEGELPQAVQQARESAIKKEIDAARSSLGQEMDCAHGFILNHFEQGLNKGHWFVVVIKKYIQQNKIDVIIADSKNIVRFNNPSVRALLQKLFGVELQPDLQEIQRLKIELEGYMRNIAQTDVRKRAEKINSVYLALGGEDVFTEQIMNAIADADDEKKEDE